MYNTGIACVRACVCACVRERTQITSLIDLRLHDKVPKHFGSFLRVFNKAADFIFVTQSSRFLYHQHNRTTHAHTHMYIQTYTCIYN